jgi:hypothetical protein
MWMVFYSLKYFLRLHKRELIAFHGKKIRKRGFCFLSPFSAPQRLGFFRKIAFDFSWELTLGDRQIILIPAYTYLHQYQTMVLEIMQDI